MPARALSICAEPGCHVLLRQGGRCAAHVRKPWGNRPSARTRGYTAEWDRESKRLRELGIVCAYCLREPMVALDHRVPLSQGGTSDLSNAVPVGQSCHARKTARESAAARRSARGMGAE